MPAVSVVVIGYNDAEHLPQALRSATGQSLRDIEVVVVDDGSADRSPALIEELAAQDRRVVPVRLERNSGGCSVPRNAGVAAASGDYITFLDSDDRLPRNAAAHLLEAARSFDADVVCGRLVRRHHDPTRFLDSHPELYQRSASYAGIAARPQQLLDTPACGKLYRRAFLAAHGVEFAPGLLYEDLLFTTQAYCTAARIAVDSRLAYVWNVHHSASAPSITNRRDLRRWADRFEVHRRIDRFLAERDLDPAVRAAKDAKFLAADFVVFLRELRLALPGDRPNLFLLGRAYLAELAERIPPDAEPDGPIPVPRAVRVAARLTADGELAAALAAADWVVTGGVGSGLPVEDGWRTAPLAALPLHAVVTGAEVAGDKLVIRAQVDDLAGRLRAAGPVSARLCLSGRVGGSLLRAAAQCRQTPAGVEVTARLPLRTVGRRLLDPRVGPELRLSVELAGRTGERVHRPLSGRDAVLPDQPLVVHAPLPALTGDAVRLVERNGRIVLAPDRAGGPVEALIGAASWLRYATGRGVGG
jgi:glycosyltransferase involved in cell wall biosynthesis